MSKATLIVGQSASLPQEIIKKYFMTMIPFTVDWAEDKKINQKNIIQEIGSEQLASASNEDLPKTSHPAPWLYKKFFEEKLQNNDSVLYVAISSKLSGAMEAAQTGKGMMDEGQRSKIFILDSESASAGEGLVAVKAAEMIMEGKEIQGIMDYLTEFRSSVRVMGSVKDLKWLKAGGRIGNISATIMEQASNLGIRPILGVKDGRLTAVEFDISGKDYIESLAQTIKNNVKEKKVRLAISHAENKEAAQQLATLLAEKLNSPEISFMSLMDNIISIHLGPSALVCAWHEL